MRPAPLPRQSLRSPPRARALALTSVLALVAIAAAAAPARAHAKAKKAAKPAAAAPAPATGEVRDVEKVKWGEADGQEVDLYTLINKNGLIAKVTNFGAILTELDTPDRKGTLGDVVLGWDTLAGYQKNDPHFGSTIGRVGNRIAFAKFELDGKTYQLAANNGPHHLHGGVKGWDKHVWTATPVETPDGPSLRLTLVSPDGDEGYPGTVNATATYTLTDDNELRIEMTATTDKPTALNMVNHTYWNLHGGTTGDIKDEILTLYADQYTPGVPPDGKVLPVAGTPFDFTKPKALGKDLMATGDKPPGYDANWIVEGEPHALRPVARVVDPKSGRVLTIEANQPGAQLYTSNYLDGTTKGHGRVHAQHAAFCIETQKFPNSINVPAWKSEEILRPGETYKHDMVLKFSTE